MEDFRFFQHFLFHAYPPLPLEGEMMWRDMVAMSHSFDFLIHSILGAAASHLSLTSSDNYASQALAHRVTSIQALNSALSRPAASAAEADARFVTMFMLVYQSSYIPDGMYEFLSMLRGCYLVADIKGTVWSPRFHDFKPRSHGDAVASLNSGDNHGAHSLLDRSLVDGFLGSMILLAPLCTTPAELKYHSAIQDTMARSIVSAVDAIVQLGGIYVLFGSASASEFHIFADPSNHVGQLLLAHFFLIECVIEASALRHINGSTPHRKDVTAAWVTAIAQSLPAAYEEYIRWPMDVVSMMLADEEWLLPKGTELVIPKDWKRLRLLCGSTGNTGLRQQWKLLSEKAKRRGLITQKGSRTDNVAVTQAETVDCVDEVL
ncbi:hypothetical protein VMCG_05762 [Cytospora schulzeri]|uniref:Transcription factor domain-containing protein n=1 Tax=Cytospora schulzeri TaxID=448051 RepID=A0A423WIP0_9PEZI|nr:hypothetical protein VMCG_05762 [Valsa malicola]